MPRYTPNPIIPVTRGTLGGVTISKNRSGLYTKMVATDPKNPRTPAQVSVRETFKTSSQAWRGLTEPQRLTWVRLAPQVVNIGRKSGEPHNPAPSALYNQLNNVLTAVGAPRIATAPIAPEATSVVASDAGNMFERDDATIHFANGIPHWAIIEATPPLSQGIMSIPQNRFRVIATIVAPQPGTLFNYLWIPAYESEYSVIPPDGQKVALRVTMVTRSGFKMEPRSFLGILTD